MENHKLHQTPSLGFPFVEKKDKNAIGGKGGSTDRRDGRPPATVKDEH